MKSLLIFDDDAKINILDVGCGTGLCAESLKAFTHSIVGIDLSENMLEKAEQRGVYNELIKGDIVDVISNLDGHFDRCCGRCLCLCRRT